MSMGVSSDPVCTLQKQNAGLNDLHLFVFTSRTADCLLKNPVLNKFINLDNPFFPCCFDD